MRRPRRCPRQDTIPPETTARRRYPLSRILYHAAVGGATNTRRPALASSAASSPGAEMRTAGSAKLPAATGTSCQDTVVAPRGSTATVDCRGPAVGGSEYVSVGHVREFGSTTCKTYSRKTLNQRAQIMTSWWKSRGHGGNATHDVQQQQLPAKCASCSYLRTQSRCRR